MTSGPAGPSGRAQGPDIALVPDIALGDEVELKKKHPCGSWQWRVFRVGADIGIQCSGCGRRALLAREIFRSRVKVYVSREKENPS
jgi:hypothetical protein